MTERGFDALPLARPEALQQPQAEAQGAQQARTIIINGEGLASGPVSTTAHAGLQARDRLRVRLVARPVLPGAAVAKGADR